MARFYFDFCQRTEVCEDSRGLDFRDTESAYLAAYEAAIEMWGDLLRERKDPRRCAFRVRDAQGALLFYFHFQEALDSCREIGRPCSPMSQAHKKAQQLLHRGQQLRGDFQQELDKAREAVVEARRLINVSSPYTP